MRRANIGYGPDVDGMRTVVGDDSLGLGKSHKRADGENAAGHGAGGVRKRVKSGIKKRMNGDMDDGRIDVQLNGCWVVSEVEEERPVETKVAGFVNSPIDCR